MISQANSNEVLAAVPNVGEAKPVWPQTSLASFVISGETTQGKAAVMEAVQRKGQEPPRHRHSEIDETFYVIEGKITFSVEGETISVPAGASVFIERGKEHSFTVETETANTLILLTPAPTQKAQVQA